MKTMHPCVGVVLATVALAGMAGRSGAQVSAVPSGVSPGAVDRYSTIATGCPAFSWEMVAGTELYELVAYRVADSQEDAGSSNVDSAAAEEVLYRRVPGGATSWTPGVEQCLAPGGRYVWFVRAVFDEKDGVVLTAGDWSEGLYFAVAAAPSAEEVEQALSVLRRFAGEEGVTSLRRAGREAVAEDGGAAQAEDEPPAEPDRSVLTAPAAIRGSMPDASGELYGVVGIVASPDGAGAAVANTSGGADLVLDGSAQGLVDTELSESGLDRRASGLQSFNFTNSGAGAMRLRVDGIDVVTTATDEDTLGDLQCDANEVAKWSGSAWQCADDEDTGLTLPFQATHATSGATFRINNSSTTGNVFALRGDNASSAGAGVYGWSTRATGITSGVVGQSSSATGTGVFGVADSSTGTNYGVGGISNSTDGKGVAGYATATSGFPSGVYGETASDNGRAVHGVSTSTTVTGDPIAVYGESETGTGVRGQALWVGVSGIGDHIGVRARANGQWVVNYGIYGTTSSSYGYAGYFDGDVEVDGTLSKSGGSFKIDHPLDPANRYLQHSFVESPDMMNVYNGNVVLDQRGEAWVELPEWFEVLNRDFRYQLTAIGAPGPALFVADEIAGNRFRIAGGSPGLEVSWQVTGIRHDPWAEAHRIPVETDKPEGDRGTYLAPELYGQPEELERNYELMHRLDGAVER